MLPKIQFQKTDILIGLLLMGVFIMGFFVSYLALGFFKLSPKPKSTPTPTEAPLQTQVQFPAAPEITKQKGVYNTVFLGYGGAGHEGSLLTDSIIVIHIDTNTKKAALISIPRDLYVTGNRKINAEAAANGFQNEGGVIKNVTGFPVDYFVAVDFGGFIKLIDALGGITVNVPKTFDDPYYPITGLENETCGKTADEIAALKAKYTDYQLASQIKSQALNLSAQKTTADLILNIAAPPLITEIAKTWLFVGVILSVIGILLFFVKRPASQKSVTK